MRRLILGELAWRVRTFVDCLLSVTDWKWTP